jgi:hypothetical protein
MARSTLARHRLATVHRFARTSAEGGGGGNGAAGGTGGTGSTGSGTDNGAAGSGTGTGGNTGGSGSSGTGSGPNGFPENTPLEQMDAPQREAYWKHYARHHEARANARADYDEQKRLADQYREQQRQQMTPDQRAIDEAKEAGRREALETSNAEQVSNLLRVSLEARGKTGDELTTLVAAANPAAFITEGKVDAAKVSAYAATLTPAQQGGGQGGAQGGGGRGADLGQGRREGGSKPSVSAGRDLFTDRHKPRQSAGSSA